ncbi:hypothetical protein Ddye_010199 [Dipteronia dyeriana]|uniref:DUF4408 domain-containing protein n=1 Tax=Dipteronia dyeriana TaxID=168575 RepID=A0AAE0CN01_9ROSI|nr:hypothetical protein Ddye_010199 [Dipteronia dyeriana]
MDDLFDFKNDATHQTYDWLGSLSKLLYRLQLLGALVFLCFLVYCIPIAAVFLRRLSAFVSSPPFVFVFFNAVIVVIALSVKFGVFSTADDDHVVSSKANAAGGTDKEEEEVVAVQHFQRNHDDDDLGKSFFDTLNNNNDVVLIKDEIFLEEEVAVILEDKEVIVFEKKTTPTPMTEVGIDSQVESDEKENPVDDLTCEEFNKKIEKFIENMRTFRRQESWLESDLMENNRTSIAVFD